MAKAIVYGLGPVGLATIWKLLRKNFDVVGFDTNLDLVEAAKIGNFQRAKSIESDITKNPNIRFASSINELPECDVSIICVGTPACSDEYDLTNVLDAIEAASCNAKYLILRSTISPGTCDTKIVPRLKQTGRCEYFTYYPEFLREAFLKEDLNHPPISVASHLNSESMNAFKQYFPEVSVHNYNFRVSEMIKVTCNIYHALKVSFANEIASVCKSIDIDSLALMELFCSDTKLNISDKYLKPGAPFSGACLEKDLIAFRKLALKSGLADGVIDSILASNTRQKLKQC